MFYDGRISLLKAISVLLKSAKFPYNPILHYASGSMCVVLCFATKKQQNQRIVPLFLPLLSVNNDLHE